MDPPFFFWFLAKPPLARAAALVRLQVFAATESKIPLSSFVYTKLIFKAFICSGQFHCSFNLSTLVLYCLFDGIEIFFLDVL